MSILLDRRFVLTAGALSVPALAYIGAIGGGAMMSCGGTSTYNEAAAEGLLRVGWAYLRTVADAQEEERMIYLASLSDSAFLEKLSDNLESYEQVSRHDFETGKTVRCDGWVLAKSEARFCAVIALRARSELQNAAGIQARLRSIRDHI